MRNFFVFTIVTTIVLIASAFIPINNYSTASKSNHESVADTTNRVFMSDTVITEKSFMELDLKNLLPKNFAGGSYSLSEVAEGLIAEARSKGALLMRHYDANTSFKYPITLDFNAYYGDKIQMIVIASKNAPYVCMEVVDDNDEEVLYTCETQRYDDFIGVGGISEVEDEDHYNFFGWAHQSDSYDSPKYETYVMILRY